MKYQVAIPKPCHENWNNMTPTDKGAFCSSCKKEVFDFTSLTDASLIKTIDSNENMCGRFLPTQLGRDISVPSNKKSKKLIASLGFTSLLALCQPVFAQGEVAKTEVVKTINSEIEVLIGKRAVLRSVIITGVVVDESGSPMPQVNVLEKGTHNRTITDFNGKYSFEVSGANASLAFTHIGYEDQEIPLEGKKAVDISMSMSVQLFTVGLPSSKKQNIFRRIGNLFKRKNKVCR